MKNSLKPALFRCVATAPARRFALCLIVAQAALGSSFAATAPDWQTRVSTRLLSIWKAAQPPRRVADEPPTEAAGPASFFTGRFDAKGRLQIDVEFDCATNAPTRELQELGMVSGTTLTVPPMCVVEGWAATGKLPAIASIAAVKKIDLPRYARAQGAVSVTRPSVN